MSIFRRLFVFTFIFIKVYSSPKFDLDRLFNMTAEDMFNEKVGDIAKHKEKLDNHRRNAISKLLQVKQSAMSFNETMTSIPELNAIKRENERMKRKKSRLVITPSPITQDLSKMLKTTKVLQNMRLKMMEEEINSILTGGRTIIPTFKDDDDDPHKLTPLFDMNVTTLSSRRVYYHSGDPEKEMYTDKLRVSYLMVQFIYMTRRQMGFMSVLRNKYKENLKYKMGYLFGLLRLVMQQQQSLYNVVEHFYIIIRNPMFSLQFYNRIVMLGVDMNDLIRYILKLNLEIKMGYNPSYYMDSSEYFETMMQPPAQPWGQHL